MNEILRIFVAITMLAFPGIGAAADATSFDPTPISIISQSTIPVGTVVAWSAASNPADMNKWLECNGQSIPAGSKYDALRSILGGTVVPNYNSQFLRGTTSKFEVGQKVSDSVRAHSHFIDAHQHTVSGTASGQTYSGTIASQTVTGTASGQSFSAVVPGQSYHYDVTDIGETWWPAAGTASFVPTVRTLAHRTVWDTTAASSVSGTTSGGTITGRTSGTSYSGTTSGGSITGFTNYAGGGYTHETGSSETAPVHTKVRYLIRAVL